MRSLEPSESLRRLRAMLVLRCFEDALLRQPTLGFQLLSRGEEAAAIGIQTAIERDDPLLCSGRSIAIALARGVPAGGLMAELLGKDGGPNRGRAGRAHLSMPSVGLHGAHGVVGGNLSVAAGVAFAQQQLQTGAVVCSLFGDGACGSGALHETMNIAALWRLPLLLICLNNGYAVSTPVREGLASRHLIDLASPFGIPAKALDGADVDAVAISVAAAASLVRSGGGPQFLELRLERLAAHSTLTREEREPSEVEKMAARDPLRLYENRLREARILDDAALEEMNAAVLAEIAAAEAFAVQAPWPDPATAVASA